MMILLRVPLARSPLAMLSSSLAASGIPDGLRAMPGKVRISSALALSNPPVVSLDEPLRRMIRSSGSPEIFRLYSSPSTRPKRMHDDATRRAVPSTVISVVFHRTRRLRTLYLSGIMASQTTFLRPLMTEEFAAKTAGNSPLMKPTKSETASPSSAMFQET